MKDVKILFFKYIWTSLGKKIPKFLLQFGWKVALEQLNPHFVTHFIKNFRPA